MKNDDEMERAKKNFLFFLENFTSLTPSTFHIFHRRMFEKDLPRKKIKPLLSLKILESKEYKMQIYCFGITQIIKIKNHV